MQDELQDRIKAFLNETRLATITTGRALGAWTVPFKRCAEGVEIICLLARWSDVFYHLEQDPQVELVIIDPNPSGIRWLLIYGKAQPAEYQEWSQQEPSEPSLGRPEERYAALRIIPRRMDLFDESRGWGARETLEFWSGQQGEG